MGKWLVGLFTVVIGGVLSGVLTWWLTGGPDQDRSISRVEPAPPISSPVARTGEAPRPSPSPHPSPAPYSADISGSYTGKIEAPHGDEQISIQIQSNPEGNFHGSLLSASFPRAVVPVRGKVAGQEVTFTAYLKSVGLGTDLSFEGELSENSIVGKSFPIFEQGDPRSKMAQSVDRSAVGAQFQLYK